MVLPRLLCLIVLTLASLTIIGAAQCPSQTASDSFSSGEGQMAGTWKPSITPSGLNSQPVPSMTILHDGVVENPRQVPYGLATITPLSSDRQNPKALWNQTLANDQYVQIRYRGGVAYSEFFAARDPGSTTPRSVGMTGDAFGYLTWENTTTGSSFISPSLDSAAWTTNPFNVHPSTQGYFDLVLRCDPVGRAKCYTLRIIPGSSSWTIYAGTSSVRSGSLLTPLKIGDVFSFMVSRTTLSAFQNGGRLTSFTDRTYKSGQVGIGLNLLDIPLWGWQSPLLDDFSAGSAGSPPVISSVSPTSLMVGILSRDFFANGTNLGICGGLVTQISPPNSGISTPAPAVVNANQLNLLPSIDVNAPAGVYNVSLASPAGLSNQLPFTVLAPTSMVVNCSSSVCDIIRLCSGCSNTIERLVTYQVMLNNNQPAAGIAIGETVLNTGWNCGQQQPFLVTTSCSNPAVTNADGTFTDRWSLGSDGYSPASCGWNMVDHWQMCGSDLSGNMAARTFGTLTGFLHWDEIQLNGYTGTLANPNPMPKGTTILP